MSPSRAEVLSLINEARARKRSKRVHVKERLQELYPSLENSTVRRNGRTYNALEYLLSDLDSYGS